MSDINLTLNNPFTNETYTTYNYSRIQGTSRHNLKPYHQSQNGTENRVLEKFVQKMGIFDINSLGRSHLPNLINTGHHMNFEESNIPAAMQTAVYISPQSPADENIVIYEIIESSDNISSHTDTKNIIQEEIINHDNVIPQLFTGDTTERINGLENQVFVLITGEVASLQESDNNE